MRPISSLPARAARSRPACSSVLPRWHATCSYRSFGSTSRSPARHKDHYATLKLPRNASKQQIKARFYELSKKYHPDAPGGSPDLFHTINDAYSILGDEQERASYDRSSSPASQAPQSAWGAGFHPHSPQARRTAGPHRSWTKPPPGAGAHWAGRRRVDPNLGFGMGFGSASGTSTGPDLGGMGARWGKRETMRERERREKREGAYRLDEEVKGESALWRFVVVVAVLLAIVGLGGGFTASADIGEGDDEAWREESRRRLEGVVQEPLD